MVCLLQSNVLFKLCAKKHVGCYLGCLWKSILYVYISNRNERLRLCCFAVLSSVQNAPAAASAFCFFYNIAVGAAPMMPEIV
jgi:hypothetical protein